MSLDKRMAGTHLHAELRLLVIDPREFTRDCLVAALQASQAFETIVATANLKEAMQLPANSHFDAALVNLAGDPFGRGKLAEIREGLHSSGKSCAILILTSQTDDFHIAAALRQGIQGFLSSDMPLDLTVDAIRIVSRGWLIYPPIHLTNLLPERPPRAKPAERSGGVLLTPRRREVLLGLQQGLTNRDIARQLSISERTIKAHVQELMRALGANNRTQVVVLTSGQLGDDNPDQ